MVEGEPWTKYCKRSRSDEETVIQPIAFPRFARDLLGFTIGENLAPERHGTEGKPDFTPADAVTHPFVFETKSTRDRADLSGYEAQVTRYLREGGQRIRRVVVTNLIGLKVYELTERNSLRVVTAVDLAFLLEGDLDAVARLKDAHEFSQFLEEYAFRVLSPSEKIDRVRRAPPWTPFEATSAEWIASRIQRCVELLLSDVTRQIAAGALTDVDQLTDAERAQVLDEVQLLAWRLGTPYEDARQLPLARFLTAKSGPPEKALRQFAAHVAYYAATRLMLVRVWEDLGLLEPTLYDGPFNEWMKRFDNVIRDVVNHSFSRAKDRYRAMFDQRNNYTWYVPTPDTYAEVIYELANTCFRSIESDALGVVYERLLERIDRKVLGQYYTPRDIISLIWNLIDPKGAHAAAAEAEGREFRVLDIATGSGGFLVEAAARGRRRYTKQREDGAAQTPQEWVRTTAAGLNGVEVQRFPAYLAELNLLIQLAHVLALDPKSKIPPLGVLATDTLSLHDPFHMFGEEPEKVGDVLLLQSDDRRERAKRIRDAAGSKYLMDVACGNPPYVGEKSASAVMQRTRKDHPYWNQFVAHHMDYLYWFLILGVSKLRQGGRFGFITTEYWLRSTGARPLRKYLGERCRVDRIILFRDLRLFPDAPGQHSMIVVGERTALPNGKFKAEELPDAAFPKVSVYSGSGEDEKGRRDLLEVLARGGRRSDLLTFRAPVSPNERAGDPWSEVVLTKEQYRRRVSLRSHARIMEIDTDEGVISGANRMRKDYAQHLPARTLQDVGGAEGGAGIFVLTAAETETLAPLTAAERKVVRPVVNTKDVFPYAAVLPESGDRMLYLPDAKDERGIRTPFPDDLPHLERHLARFQPLLEAKIRQYGEDRPWWTLHRAREAMVGRPVSEGFADYCLMSRWGEGGNLVVGLPPARSLPDSGLHALIPPEGVPATYLCGVMNSSPIQALADTLPPGKITAEDLRELGLPFVPECADVVSRSTLALAEIVTELVKVHGQRFPGLVEALRGDITLASPALDVWSPEKLPSAHVGPLKRVTWAKALEPHGSQSHRIEGVLLEEDLLGRCVRAVGARSAGLRVFLDDVDKSLITALCAWIRGCAARGLRLADLPEQLVATDLRRLGTTLDKDRDAVEVRVNEYRKQRAKIDDVLGDLL